jgi:hypothetical protein
VQSSGALKREPGAPRNPNGCPNSNFRTQGDEKQCKDDG